MTGLDLTLPSGADPMNLPPQQHLGLEPTPLSPTTLAQPDEHPAYLAERQRLEQTRQAREDAFLADFRLSLKSNPKAVGEAQQAARKLGLPTAAVEANIDVAKEVLRQRDMRDRELWKTHPILMRTLQDREFLRLAHDDLDNLAATDTVFAMMGRKWEAGRATNERGYLGARMAAGLVSQEDKDRRAELDAIIQNAARDSGFIASTTEVLGQMSGTLPQALAAGGAAAGVASLGGPVTAGTAFTYGFGTALFTQSALIEGGNAYLDMLDQGVEQDKAAVLAMGVGLVNGALELAGAKVVAKPFQMATRNIVRRAVGGLTQETAGKAFGSFVVEYAKSVGAEVSTEVLQEVTNMVAEAVGRPDGQPEPSWGEIRGRLGDIFTKTAQSMSVLGLPGSVAHYYSQAQRASQALDRAEAFQRQVELSAESKVREAHPEQFEGYAQLVSEQAKATDLFVGSEKFVQAMDAAGVTRADLQAKQPELFQQLEKAEENADLQMDVVIRNSAFQAKLAKTPLGDALMEHVRFEQDGMSMAEAQEWIGQQQALAKEAGSLVQEKRAVDQEFVESGRRVEESLYQQIRATKRLPNAKQERAAAQFYRDMVVTQAARRGLTPEQFYERYPVRVVRGDGQQAATSLRQNEAPAALVSALRANVDALPTKATAAAGWKSALQGLVNKGAVKQAEIEWTGLQEWLDLQDGKVTKEQVQAFLDGNGVQVQTVQLGGETDAVRRQQAIDQELENLDRIISYPQPGENRDEAIQQRTVLQEEWHSLRGGQKDAKFANYQLPGGTNYREVLLTLPEKPQRTFEQWVADTGRTLSDYPANEVAQLRDQWRQEETRDNSRFHSSHFAQPNILAHLRLNDRIDADGKRVLFVEELQSDWAQKGRKAGFQRQAPDKPFAIGQYGDGTWWAKDGSGVMRASAETREELDAALRGLSTQPVLGTIGKIPRAPFVETTEGWLNLALKQVLLTAVNEGYDKVAFITGEQSAERYDLSKQISDVQFVVTSGGAGKANAAATTGTLRAFDLNGKLVLDQFVNDPAQIEEYVGKDIAQKLLDAPGVHGTEAGLGSYRRQVSGIDLKVGGEGMLAFYDKIVPKAVEKLAKKLGGTALGAVTLEGEAPITGGGGSIKSYPVAHQQPAITITDAMRAEIGKGLALFQNGEGDAKGGFIPETLTVLLNEKADVSTFLHESAHAFLTIYGDMAAQGDAQATADLTTLLDWFGVKDVATWNAMSLEQQRKHHEKFAYSFEGYLFDGTAPSEAMQGLFDRFKVWLRRVYKTIRDSIGAAYRQEFGEDLPILTGEVRGVMDRMLASEEAIAEAEAVRSMAPLFQTQEQSGMDDAKWAAYKQEAERARDAAVASLEKDSLRQMQWLDRARGRVLKQLQREHDTVRKRVRKEVATEVAARPAVRADRWLRTGKMPNEDGTTAQGDPDPNHKLDKAAVAAILGKDADKAQAYVRAEGGLSPDAVAEQIYGPDASGEAMLRELLALPPLGEAIDARTDERMLAEHSELADPEVREAAVERALHNEARARFVAAELRHLVGATQPVRLMLAAAKAAAKETIQGLPVREVSAKRFAQAEARAARQAMEALRKGDSALAVQWQQKRLLQHALATEAGKVQADVDKALRGFQKLRLSDEKVAKTRSVPLVNAARWILSRYNLGTPGQQATSENALTAVQAYDPALFERLKPLLFAAQQDGHDYRNLSVEQFRDLAAKVEGLWFQAKRGNEIIADGKAMARDAVKQEILATLAPRLEGKGGKPRALTKGEKNKRSFGSIRAALTHVESLVLKWDGGKPGALHRYLFHLIRDPFDSYQLEKNRLVKAVFDRATQLPNLHGAKIDASQPGEIADTFKDRGELISALLHAGNKHNLEVNGLGRGWFARPAKGQPVDVSGFWRFVQRAVDEGKLTLADLYFVQYVWDLFEKDLKPTVQKAHFENYGYYMDEVEAVPFALRFGGETVNFRGGYYPAKADPDWVDAQPGQVSTDGVTESAGAFLDRHPSTGKGFTITRVEGVERPLLQDIRLVAQAFDEELRFAYLQRPGRDISSLLNDPEIAAAIRAIDPNALQETFRPWLNDTMHNRVMAPGGHPVLNRFLVALRRNVGLATMFGNVPNALQQPTGLATAALYVPMRFLRASAANLARAPRETAARVTALSKFMRLRLENQIGQLVDDMDVLVEPTKLGQTQAWFRRNGYFLQRMFQNPVDIISWTAAFDQAVTEGKTEKQAVTWADTVVRRSQGSGTAADISKAERAGAIGRLLTQFGTFWLSQLNTVLGREGLPSQARAAAMAVGVAGVVAGAIAQALRGGWDDEDDDGALWDDVTGWAFSEAARTAASTFVPFVGPSAIQIATGERGGRFTPGASVGAVESAGRALRSLGRVAMDPERDLKGQDIKDAATLLSLLLGIPLTAPARPASYGFDMATGQVQPSGAVDAARGLVTGAVAPGTRQ